MAVAEHLVEPGRQLDVVNGGRPAVSSSERSFDAVAVEGPGDEVDVGEADDLPHERPAQDGLSGEMGGEGSG